ncbi:signal peptidase I [Patescibacteria group bacterium]|nr:signal peptidase I [Patescibacteria group bacterium]
MDRDTEVVTRTQTSSFIRDVIQFTLIALLIVVPVRWFIAQPFIVHGKSMDPTFTSGQYLIIDQISYRFEDPARGDVIIMRFPENESVFFIKRIIGLPGETVELQGSRVIIRAPNTEPIVLAQPYLAGATFRPEYATYTLGDGEYFVMGDNRDQSSDSRVWGPLPERDIVGRVFVRLFPPATISLFPGFTSTP